MIRQAATAVLLAAAATVAPVAAPAAAAVGLPGMCPDANGVTVVVDFNELGGGTVVRCAQGPQANGLVALENAGFIVEGTPRWGKGFICRIQGKPGADTEPCLNTPPASAYWSYWHASNGGTWKYSDYGVLNRTPPTGSFEGWSFAKNKSSSSVPPPGLAPRRPEPPPPPPPSPPPPLPPPVTTKPPAGGQSPPPPQGGPADSPAPSATMEPASSPIASPIAIFSVVPTSTEAITTVAEPPIGQTGAPWGVIAAGVLLCGLAVTALVIQRRRKAALDPHPES